MCRADSGGRGSRARSRRPAFAVRASRGAHAHHLSCRSRQAAARQFTCIGIVLSPHAFEPATDRLHGELGGVAGDPDADESGVGGHIVYAVGHDLAEALVGEVVHVHALRIAFGAIISSAILEVAN